jgi:hypothetical protein
VKHLSLLNLDKKPLFLTSGKPCAPKHDPLSRMIYVRDVFPGRDRPRRAAIQVEKPTELVQIRHHKQPAPYKAILTTVPQVTLTKHSTKHSTKDQVHVSGRLMAFPEPSGQPIRTGRERGLDQPRARPRALWSGGEGRSWRKGSCRVNGAPGWSGLDHAACQV